MGDDVIYLKYFNNNFDFQADDNFKKEFKKIDKLFLA